EISDGTIAIGGRVMNNVLPKDRDIAMVFQNYALYPQMTVAQNMGFALKIRGVAKSNLDAQLRVEMRTEIARIQRLLGVATVYVTHDQTEAMTMGDRVAVLRGGLLQ